MRERKSILWSGTFAEPIFDATLPDAKLDVSAWAWVSKLKKVVFPTRGKPTRPIFMNITSYEIFKAKAVIQYFSINTIIAIKRDYRARK